jgi:predicted amidohydrolase YtcJ
MLRATPPACCWPSQCDDPLRHPRQGLLPQEYQVNSTRQFMRELNSLGVTSVIDAGGGSQNYPDDYEVIEKLHKDGEMTLRVAYNLYPEAEGGTGDFTNWSKQVKPGDGDDTYRHNGAGEMLVYSAADFEDFRVARPDMPPEMEGDLEPSSACLAERRWPWRMHATYDQTISRALDVFEKVNRDIPFTASTGSSTMPKRSATAASTASRRWAAASRFSTAWRFRANISSNVTARKPPRPRRPSSA